MLIPLLLLLVWWWLSNHHFHFVVNEFFVIVQISLFHINSCSTYKLVPYIHVYSTLGVQYFTWCHPLRQLALGPIDWVILYNIGEVFNILVSNQRQHLFLAISIAIAITISILFSISIVIWTGGIKSETAGSDLIAILIAILICICLSI